MLKTSGAGNLKVMKKILGFVKLFRARFEGSSIRFKQNVLQPIPYWITSLITSLIAVLYAKLFALGETLTFYLFHLHAWLLFFVTPFCFIASWWIVKRYADYARGSGIPQVMSAIEFATPRYNFLVDKLLSIRVMIVKIVSSLLMIVGGGAIIIRSPKASIYAWIASGRK